MFLDAKVLICTGKIHFKVWIYNTYTHTKCFLLFPYFVCSIHSSTLSAATKCGMFVLSGKGHDEQNSVHINSTERRRYFLRSLQYRYVWDACELLWSSRFPQQFCLNISIFYDCSAFSNSIPERCVWKMALTQHCCLVYCSEIMLLESIFNQWELCRRCITCGCQKVSQLIKASAQTSVLFSLLSI